MGIEEALEIISNIESMFLLEDWHTRDTVVTILALLLRLRKAPGPEEIIRSKVFTLEGWVQSLFRKYESSVSKDIIKGTILAECQSLKNIVTNAVLALKS
jgi:hypothetical protein